MLAILVAGSFMRKIPVAVLLVVASIAGAVVGGMTFATLCGLLLILAFYIISEKMARSFWKATGLKRIKFKHRMLRR